MRIILFIVIAYIDSDNIEFNMGILPKGVFSN
jgi:hypothetical protein